MHKVSGVGRDEPTIVNEKGAKQSRTLYRFDLLDPQAMFEMTKVLKEGAEKYGAENWRGIPVRDHLNHLLIHAYAYLAGDNSDDHLSHIMCRAMFAQAVDIDDNQVVKTEEKDDLMKCAMCRSETLAKKEGRQYCGVCGTIHDITVTKYGTESYYHINPIKIKLYEEKGTELKSRFDSKLGGFVGGD